MSARPNFTIARVIARLNIGGPAIQAILMTDVFRQRGYRPLLLTGEVPPGEGSMEYMARDRGITPIRIGAMSRKVSWTKDLATLWQLIRIFRRERPVVVHTHTAKAGTVGRLAAMATRVPVRVHTFHGHVFRGYFSPLVTRVFLAIERFLARHTDQIVAISESQKRELAEVYRVAPAEKIAVIPLGFDLDPFLSVNHRDGTLRRLVNCEEDTFLVGWVGRLTAIKNPDFLLDFARSLSQRSRSVRIAVVGDGELRRHCESQTEAAGLGNVVRFTGWQQHLERVYADLDLVVLTSINEGTPVSLLEAMASGRPFISTDVGGVRDLMVGRARKQSGFEIFENGILAPADNQVFAEAASFLKEHPEIRQTMGEAGRKFVKARFSLQRLADDLESLYLSLARCKRNLQLDLDPVASGQRIDMPNCAAAQKEAS